MTSSSYASILNSEKLAALFPPERGTAFFDALYGDAEEAAFTIRLEFLRTEAHRLHFQFCLEQRPGKCLACNLTYGLPQVFTRHPLLAVGKLADTLTGLIGTEPASWALGSTREMSRSLHVIPFIIKIA